jgi:hypothetical protein
MIDIAQSMKILASIRRAVERNLAVDEWSGIGVRPNALLRLMAADIIARSQGDLRCASR